MSEPSKEELARLLGAMTGVEHENLPEEEQVHDDGTWAQHPPENFAPAAPAMRIPPRPNTQQTPPTPRDTAPVRPGLPPQPVLMPYAAQATVRPALVKTLAFKQTLIPILLTLGLLCPAVGMLGFLAGPLSPFYLFREPWFCVPLFLVGLVMLTFAGLTMAQVKASRR
jgi:hypothetical protein